MYLPGDITISESGHCRLVVFLPRPEMTAATARARLTVPPARRNAPGYFPAAESAIPAKIVSKLTAMALSAALR